MDIETLKALTVEDIVWLLTERADDVKAARKIVSAIKRHAREKRYYETHKDDPQFKERVSKRMARYHEKNKERLNAKTRKYYAENREALSEKQKMKYREKKLSQEEEKKKRAAKVLTAASIGIPTVETKRLHKITTPFDIDTDMKPKTDKEKLAEANRELRQHDERKDQMEWEEWWRQRNIILQRIENIEQRIGKKHKVFEH